jgi:hypothetical protein
MNLLDVSHPTHNLLSSNRSGMHGQHLCNEYIKGVDAFIDFVKKDMLDNIRGNFCTCI